MTAPAEHVVVDASAMVDLLARTSDRFSAVRARLARTVMHAPAHFDAEVLSALGRLQRSGVLTVKQVKVAVGQLRDAPITRHELAPLLIGAWARRDSLRLTEALYVELSSTADLRLLTTDERLSRAYRLAEAIT